MCSCARAHFKACFSNISSHLVKKLLTFISKDVRKYFYSTKNDKSTFRLFQQVVYKWRNKGCGVYYPAYTGLDDAVTKSSSNDWYWVNILITPTQSKWF